LSEVLQNVQSVAVGVAVGNAIGVGVADSVAFGDILVLKKKIVRILDDLMDVNRGSNCTK
jgi:hypothetical protein